MTLLPVKYLAAPPSPSSATHLAIMMLAHLLFERISPFRFLLGMDKIRRGGSGLNKYLLHIRIHTINRGLPNAQSS
jgi:hypothetical protein